MLKVSVSSLNRHAVATREDVGTSKALCLKKHFQSIFPECHIDAKVILYDSSSEEEILSGHPDFVLDCIDNIDTKVGLFMCSFTPCCCCSFYVIISLYWLKRETIYEVQYAITGLL